MKEFIELKWTLGLSPLSSSVFSLASDTPLDVEHQNRTKCLYVQDQNIIVFDENSTKQTILSGHMNAVSSITVSSDKRFAVSGGEWADSFPSAIIVWDLISNSDVRLISLAPNEGVAALTLSKDSKYIAALIDVHEEKPSQRLRIWNWMDSPKLNCTDIGLESEEFHHDVSFSSFDDFHHIVSTGSNGVLTWLFNPETGSLTSSAGSGFRDLETVAIGTLKHTTFCAPSRLLSLSSGGFGVVWDLEDNALAPKPRQLLRLKGATTCVCFQEKYLAFGFEDSMIRIYDQDFKILNWCNNSQAGEIFSLSFSSLQLSNDEQFPECVVAGSKGIRRVHFSSASENAEMILDWQISELSSVAVHPNGDFLCIGTHCSRIELWSLSQKKRMLTKNFNSRHGETSAISCLEFSACGDWLIAGFEDGALKFMRVEDDFETEQAFKSYSQPIAKIITSSFFVAVMDVKDAVLAYRFFSRKQTSEGPTPKEWILIGRQHAHKRPIQDILFSPHSPPRLFSLGFDRMIQEFSLDTGSLKHVASTLAKGDMLTGLYVQQSPPSYDVVNEDFLLTFTTDFKANFWNARRNTRTPSASRKEEINFFENEMSIVQTVLGPAVGSPAARVEWVSEEVALYASLERGLGMFRIPEMGWPVRTGFIVTLPICSMKILPDRSHAVTVGGNGMSLYALNTDALDDYIAQLEHDDYCVSVLGKAEIHRLKEAFLRVQDMESSDDGDLGSITLSEARTIFRLQGHYLSQDAFETISAELSRRPENRRKRSGHDINLSFEDFLRIYTNNRNYCVSDKDEARQHFDNLASRSPTKSLEKREFLKLLSQKGDKMSSAELSNAMESILGDKKQLPDEINQEMIEELLSTEG